MRGGVANVFPPTEPLRGWREVLASEQRTHLDWARCVKHLADVRYPDAERIVLAVDQLTTHSPAALYAAFPAAEARRLAGRIELHYTPKHGSWLNTAEIEPAVLQRQCLRRRLPDLAALGHEATAWAARRNPAAARVSWQFSTADARTRLRRLYPAFDG